MSLFINDWKNWCRTCGKNNFSDFLDFLKWNTLDQDLLENIQKLFQNSMLTIPADDNVICIDCYSYLKQFLAFTKQCRKISDMFTEIHLDYESFGDCDLLAIRNRYDLQDIIEQKSLKIISDIDHNNTADINDLIKIEIKVEEIADKEFEQVSKQQKIYAESQKNLVVINKKKNTTKSTSKKIIKQTQETMHIEMEDILIESDDNIVNDHLTKTNCLNTKNNAKDVFDETVKEDKNKKSMTKTKMNIMIKCAICNAGFKEQIKYETHMLKKHSILDYPFECLECPKRFASARGLQVHELIHVTGYKKKRQLRKDPFVCEQCGKWCVSNTSLKEHLSVHSNEYPFECTQCFKKFKNIQSLRRHKKAHDGIVYICDACGLRFSTKRTITSHMIVHSELKKFKCNYCGNEYKRSKALKAHLIYHSGLKPYKCPFCNKSFTYGTSCRLHKKTVHPQELAELEASGEVQPFTNLPKLEYLQPK